MPNTFNVDTVLNARRLLGAAQRGLGDLSAVMASPPTITNPAADGNASTIQAGQGINAGTFSPGDPTRVTLFGGPAIDQGNNAKWRIQTLSRQAGARFQGHSACEAFFTNSPSVDFALRCNGARWIAYVTNPDGVRARIAATDQAQAFANLNYYKLDFGSAAGGGRLVEIYLGQGSNFGGINVPNGYSIWPADLAQQPKIAAVWDSFGEGSMNDLTLNLKLATIDWFSAVFGCNNPHVNAIASTGVIATAGANNYLTFGQRVAAGDMDASRVGHFDLVSAFGSVNDGLTANGGIASPAGDATVQAAYQAYIAALMIAQPRAIIVGAGPEMSNAAAAVASRTAAYKAGFTAAAKGDGRMIWLDGSVFERTGDTGVIGVDGVHPGGVFGARHLGERLARQTVNYLSRLA